MGSGLGCGRLLGRSFGSLVYGWFCHSRGGGGFCFGRSGGRGGGSVDFFGGDVGFLACALYACVAVDQLDVGHGGRVAGAGTGLYHARVAAVTLGVARGKDGEDFFYRLFLTQESERLAATGESVCLAESNHFFDERAEVFRLGERGFDLLVLDQRAGEVREQRKALVCGAMELAASNLVSHFFSLLVVPTGGTD